MVSEALDGLPVKPNQVTGDEGKAIVYHAEKLLGVQRNSDLFHVNQEIVRGATGPLAAKERHAQNEYDKVMGRTPSLKSAKENSSADTRQLRLETKPKLKSQQEKARLKLTAAIDKRTQALEANSRIGEVYHPFDLATGKKQDADTVGSLLGECFEKVEQAAKDLSEKCEQRIAKAKRILPRLGETIAFFFSTVDRVLKANPLSSHLEPLFLDLLLPAKYLELAAGRERDVQKKHCISELSKELLSQFHARAGPLGREAPTLIQLEKLAQNLA
jgi:hypothetical protein